MAAMKRKVLVLGAGVIGLSCAVRIQESCPDVSVTIMAEKFTPHTTSDGAAGFCEVFCVADTDPALVNALCEETYQYMIGLAMSPDAAIAKAQLVSGYHYRDHVMEKELDFDGIAESYRPLTPLEISRVPGAKDGRFYTSVTLDVSDYLEWLTKRFIAQGGKLIQKRVNSMEELSSDWEVVINCVGLGAYELINDKKMEPIRGQVFRVRAPWMKHFFVFEKRLPTGGYDATYILPNVNSAVVGGTFQHGNWDVDINEGEAKAIWDKAISKVPSLKDAKILRRWAGLRPSRQVLRLESEVMVIGKDKRKMNVVHNYGHGGAGITLHWACARRSVEMVTQILQDNGRSGGFGSGKTFPSKL